MLSSVLLFFSFSGGEVMLILFVALILFGGDKFPEIARGLGKGIREFKDMSDGVKREIHTQINSYEANPDRDVTPVANTPVTPPAQPATEAPHDALPAHEPTPQEHAVASLETVEKPPLPKPDLSQPPNTISHQSY